MSNTETNRANLKDLLDGIASGRLLEVFDKYYADDVVMRENGVVDPERVGKEKNRAYESYFVENSEWQKFEVGPILADGDHTAYGAYMELTFQGHPVKRHQWSVQTWKDGKIVDEAFYYQG